MYGKHLTALEPYKPCRFLMAIVHQNSGARKDFTDKQEGNIIATDNLSVDRKLIG